MAQSGRGGGGAPGGKGGGGPSAGPDKAMGDRDKGPKGPQGGFSGRGGGGAIGGKGGGGVSAGPDRAMGGGDNRSFGREISDLFGGPAAYARNKYRPGGGSVTVPNVPNASLGQQVGAVLGAFPGVMSAPKIGMEVYDSFQPGYKPGLGIGQGIIDKIFGGTPGGIEGNTQVGRINDQGDPGLNRDPMSPQAPQAAPLQPSPSAAPFGPQPTQQSFMNGLPSHSVPQNYQSLFPNSLSERDKQLLYARALS